MQDLSSRHLLYIRVTHLMTNLQLRQTRQLFSDAVAAWAGKADLPDEDAEVDGEEAQELPNGSGRARSNAMDETPAGRPRSGAADESPAGRPRSNTVPSTNGAASGMKQKTLRFAPGS